MKTKLCWSAAIFLFCLLYFIPSKVGADTEVDLLSKCTSLKIKRLINRGTNLEQVKTSSKPVEEEITLRTLKKLIHLVEATV